MKKGQRVESKRTGQFGVVEKVHRKTLEVTVLWGVADSRKVKSRVPMGDLAWYPTGAEIPQKTTEEPGEG